MIKLRYGYVVTGIITGFILLISFFTTLPDGKLHIVFCDVGQGDAAYIRFPDNRDMVIDGGPNDRVVACLSRHMPFWDRRIDLVVLTHPQKDHMNGLISILSRYRVDHIVRSDIGNTTEGFNKFIFLIADKKIDQQLVTAGENIAIRSVKLSVIWPTREQMAMMKLQNSANLPNLTNLPNSSVLGATDTNVNDASVVLHLAYGSFDVLFPGDADDRVDDALLRSLQKKSIADDGIVEVLKVPHHGSKTSMTDAFLDVLFRKAVNSRPGLERGALAVISVGKNSYGHPAPDIINKLEEHGATVMRTDQEGDIEVISDGKIWTVQTQNKK